MKIFCNLGTEVNKVILSSFTKWYRTQRSYVARIAEVGRLQPPKPQGKYESGQLFLHSVFGYRGVVLFPWHSKVFDRDEVAKRKEDNSKRAVNPEDSEVLGHYHTFYQVLIDARDSPFIKSQTDAVTFLGSPEGGCKSVYTIPGLDYVSHKDIWPYTSLEMKPLEHELFDKYFRYTPSKNPSIIPRDTLRAWQKKSHSWLELSNVHKETTDNIRVTVIPFYMGSRESQSSISYWWRYCVRLENLSAGNGWVRLRERHWRIFSLSGTLETVRGRGVVGQEPVLSGKAPAFQYCSHVSLHAPSGHMWGTFRMERQDGYTFDCRIPPFMLESKANDELSNPPLGL